MREMLLARYLYDLSFREIAREFHINELAARVRCARASMHLRERMEKMEDEERTLRKAMAGLTFAISPLFTRHVLEGIRASMPAPIPPPASTATLPAPGWAGWHTLAHTALWKATAVLVGGLVLISGAVMLHHHAQHHHKILPHRLTGTTAAESSRSAAVKEVTHTARKIIKPATTSAVKIASAHTGSVKTSRRIAAARAASLPLPLPVKRRLPH